MKKILTFILKLKPINKLLEHNSGLVESLWVGDKAVLESRKTAVALFAERARKGHIVKVILENEEKLWDMAWIKGGKLLENFEELLNHPLCKKYLKQKPALYIDPLFEGDAAVSSEQLIIVSKRLVEKLSPEEAKATIAHEIGHILSGDVSAQSGLWRQTINQRKERMADKVGAIISGEPEALKTGLKKTCRLGSRKSLQSNLEGNREYPSFRSRSHTIDKVAEAMANPEKHQYLLAEIERHLEEANRYR